MGPLTCLDFNVDDSPPLKAVFGETAWWTGLMHQGITYILSLDIQLFQILRLSSSDLRSSTLSLTTGYGWDPENRMSYATWGGTQYAYDSKNKRIWTGNYTCPDGFCGPGYGWQFQSETVFFYGIDGRRIASYTPQVQYSSGTPHSIYYLLAGQRVYFKKKYIANANPTLMAGGTALNQDRLGSIGKYFPYGEDRSGAPNDTVKFATYTRDSTTGLDYADQRYYAGGSGRFISADPLRSNAHLGTSLSWNRYSYVHNDAINFFDPTGLEDTDFCDDFEDFDEGCLGEGTGGQTQSGRDDAAKAEEARKKALLAKRQKRFNAVKQAIHDPATIDPVFGESILDCIAGLETEWTPNSSSGSHVGMYHSIDPPGTVRNQATTLILTRPMQE